MKARASMGSVAAALLLASPAAWADLVSSLFPSPVTAPAALGFSNSTTSGLLNTNGFGSASPVETGPTYNFSDRWTFTLADNADVGGLAGTFNFVDAQGIAVTQGIENLQMRLFGPGTNPSVVGWQSVANLAPNVQYLFSIVSPTPFMAGNYSVDVRGRLVGGAASYSGTLNVIAPVPLPAALPLLGAGLLMFPFLARRRLRND